MAIALFCAVNNYAQMSPMTMPSPDSFLLPGYADVNYDHRNYVNNVFGLLEAHRVPTGLLLDYAFDFTEPKAFNGVTLHDSTLMEPGIFSELYKTLFTSRFNNSISLRHPHVHDSLFYIARQPEMITVSGLLFTYNAIDPNAQTNGKIDVVNGQLKDKYVSGVWQNPYQQLTTLAITPSVIQYSQQSVGVVFPQSLWLTNAGSSVSSIQFDAGDGTGYRSISFDVPLNISYPDTGWKHWKFKVNRTGGQPALYTHSKVYFGRGSGPDVSSRTAGPAVSARGSVVDRKETVWADESYNGLVGGSRLVISYRNAADPVIRRPLIVAEGFDPGHITKIEEKEGVSTFGDFIMTIAFSQSSALRTLISNDPCEYDIIYVNWMIGTDFLQRNALVLESVIRWVNANKQPLGGVPQPNVVLGTSMGGIIARMALGRMDRGEGTLNGSGGFAAHQTRLFISMDAPHQGANIPLGAQAAARHAAQQYIASGPLALGLEFAALLPKTVSPLRTLTLADQPAARQMLIQHLTTGYNINNTVHENFRNELRTQWAYPVNIRNVAISNGNECGIDQEYLPGSRILYFNLDSKTRILGDIVDVLTGGGLSSVFSSFSPFIPFIIPGSNRFQATLDVKTLANGGGNQVYYGNIKYKKKVLWLVPVTHNIANKAYTAPPGLLPLDTYPGGFYDITMGALPNSVIRAPLFTFNSNFTLKRRFAFVHTTSALDIGGGNQTIKHTQHMARYIGATPPAAPFDTPFDNFTTAFNANEAAWAFENETIRPLNNEPHEWFFIRSANWLAAELNRVDPAPGPAANCSAFCSNLSVTGPATVCTNATYTVPSVTGATYYWTASPSGSVTFSGSSNAVTVTKNAGYNGNVTISVSITSSCGTFQSSKNITTGLPPIPTTIGSFNTNGMQFGGNTVYEFFAVSPPLGVTEYGWMVSYGTILSGTGTNTINVKTGAENTPSPTFSVRLRYKNACGWGEYLVRQGKISGGAWRQRKLDTADANSSLDRQATKMTVSPNPVNNTLSVSLQPETSSILEVMLLDYSGRMVLKKQFPDWANSRNINVSHLPPGGYFIRIFDGEKWLSGQVVIAR